MRYPDKSGWGTLAAIMAACFPWPAQAAYFEAFGGFLAVGTSYEDPGTIWISLIRLAMAVTAFFIVMRFMRECWTLKTNYYADIEAKAMEALKGATMAIVAVMGIAYATPYAVHAFMSVIGGKAFLPGF